MLQVKSQRSKFVLRLDRGLVNYRLWQGPETSALK